jgi:hypothetical protein
MSKVLAAVALWATMVGASAAAHLPYDLVMRNARARLAKDLKIKTE